MSARVPHRILGRTVLVLCAALGVLALGIVLVAVPDGAPTSSDAGAPSVPWWAVLLPAAVGIALTLTLPRRVLEQPAIVSEPARHRAATWILLALAAAFPLAVGALGLARSEGYVLLKALLLIALPAAVVGVLRGVRIDRVRDAQRWWAPIVVVVVWALLAQVAPWNPRPDLDGVDPATLLVTAVATALTAGIGEELFYRRWLQTRLEASLGPAPGIALASLVFALMHLASHGTGAPVLDVARVVVAQGSFGLLLGILWWRHRNLPAIIAAHVVMNGWPIAEHLVA
ncbi:abortive infection protein [Clavibacter tessellarius]|uniref:Abortive infection protein n=1 Tax=Clavibacter tessellarius TaxID=31965 RepID=A0A154UYU1_9MICO|nr:abortive infection protein [Clavibacter michiganensis subsp. tessellarius]